eukprot:EG_transcript_31022
MGRVGMDASVWDPKSPLFYPFYPFHVLPEWKYLLHVKGLRAIHPLISSSGVGRACLPIAPSVVVPHQQLPAWGKGCFARPCRRHHRGREVDVQQAAGWGLALGPRTVPKGRPGNVCPTTAAGSRSGAQTGSKINRSKDVFF